MQQATRSTTDRRHRWGLAFALALAACSGQAAEFSVEGSAIRITGRIEKGDTRKFQALLATAQGHAAFESRGTFLLDSPGGQVHEALEIARIVELGFSVTVVPPGAKCWSACFLLYAAGSYRTAGVSAAFGVHRVSTSNPDPAAYARASAGVERYLRRRGIPAPILQQMAATEASELFQFGNRWLIEQGIEEQMSGHPAFMAQVAGRCGADPLLAASPGALARELAAHRQWLGCMAEVRHENRQAVQPQLTALVRGGNP